MNQPKSRTFRYEEVYVALRQQILEGKLPYGSFLPSEKEIGQLYHVERTTVRKALKLLVDDGLVVKKAGKGSMVIGGPVPVVDDKRKMNRTVAFLLPKGTHNNDRITQPFYASLFFMIEHDLQQNGLSVLYSTLNTVEEFNQFLYSNDCAAVIFVSNISDEILNFALQRKIPAVVVNNNYEKMPSVVSNGFQGTYMACKYLLENGHRNIGVIKGVAGYYTTRERLYGCIVALQEAGITLQPQNILQGDWDYESGHDVVKQMLAQNPDPPTALVAFNDHLALGAIHAITEAGKRVPFDISVIGFDNMNEANYSIPALTTIEDNPALTAHVAVDNLLEQLHGRPAYPVKIQTPVSLVIRSSVCCL